MEIKWMFRGNYYTLSIGHETPWFSQIPSIILSQEWYENGEVVFAKVIYKK